MSQEDPCRVQSTFCEAQREREKPLAIRGGWGNESKPANSVKPHICPRVPGGDTAVGADDHPARLRLIKLTRKGGGGSLIGRLRGLVRVVRLECGKGDAVSGNRRQPAGFDGVSSSSEQGMPG